MIIIADTGPIIGLAKIDQLLLLKKLATEVVIAPFVQKELYGKIGPESKLIDQALNDFIRVAEPNISKAGIYANLSDIDEGERQSICLASTSKKGSVLLIDDYAGRCAADKFAIPKVGSIGILLLAKKKGLINNVGSLLHEMRSNGYWLSGEILTIAQKLAKE